MIPNHTERSSTSATAARGAARRAGVDGGALGTSAPPAPTIGCGDHPAACLQGTAETSAFTVPARKLVAAIYDIYPSGTVASSPAAVQTVASDGTWAFGGLSATRHYYVQVTADFNGAAGPAAVAARVGPFTVPTPTSPVAVRVKPVTIEVLEQRIGGNATQVEWALAHVFDPATAIEVPIGASVTIAVGGASTSLGWDTTKMAYFAPFPTPPAAQPSYEITTHSSTNATWTVTADPPTFTGAITAPSGAAVNASQALAVTWLEEPTADYETVDVYAGQDDDAGQVSAWTLAYHSPQPVAPDVTTETVPGGIFSRGGKYLLDVTYTKASCPATADGCVYANAVAEVPLTAQ